MRGGVGAGSVFLAEEAVKVEGQRREVPCAYLWARGALTGDR